MTSTRASARQVSVDDQVQTLSRDLATRILWDSMKGAGKPRRQVLLTTHHEVLPPMLARLLVRLPSLTHCQHTASTPALCLWSPATRQLSCPTCHVDDVAAAVRGATPEMCDGCRQAAVDDGRGTSAIIAIGPILVSAALCSSCARPSATPPPRSVRALRDARQQVADTMVSRWVQTGSGR